MSLVKLAITNPIQMRNFNWMKNNPNMGPAVAGKYDLLTNLASQARTDKSKLPAMHKAVTDLKASGVQKLDPSLLTKKVAPAVSQTQKAAMSAVAKPMTSQVASQVAGKVAPLATKSGMLSKLVRAIKPLAAAI